MFIDKDAKIFGKVNIIDFFIVLAVIGVVAFLAIKARGNGVATAPSAQNFEVKFYVEEAENFRVNGMSVGDNLYDDSKNILLGTITALDIQDAVIFNPNAEGTTVKSPKEGYSSMEITTELKAQRFENGIIISGNKYGIGHSLTIRAGKSFVFLKVSGIEEKE